MSEHRADNTERCATASSAQRHGTRAHLVQRRVHLLVHFQLLAEIELPSALLVLRNADVDVDFRRDLPRDRHVTRPERRGADDRLSHLLVGEVRLNLRPTLVAERIVLRREGGGGGGSGRDG